MKRNTKKLLSVLLALFMLATVMPFGGFVTAFASDVVASGECGAEGDNATWTLYNNGRIVISGTGDMADFFLVLGEDDYSHCPTEVGIANCPWIAYRPDIIEIVIEEGITGIGQGAFALCYNAQSVALPDSLLSAGEYAFANCVKLTLQALPPHLETISEGAFYVIKAAPSLSFPESLTYLGSYAFAYVGGIGTLTLPSANATVMDAVFAYTSDIDELIIPEGVEETDLYVLFMTNSNITVRNYSELFAMPEEVEYHQIPENAV